MGAWALWKEHGIYSVQVPSDGDCWFWSVVLAVNFPGTGSPFPKFEFSSSSQWI